MGFANSLLGYFMTMGAGEQASSQPIASPDAPRNVKIPPLAPLLPPLPPPGVRPNLPGKAPTPRSQSCLAEKLLLKEPEAPPGLEFPEHSNAPDASADRDGTFILPSPELSLDDLTGHCH